MLPSCSETKLAGAGGDCFQATDCEPGLVCVPSDGRRVCSADLTGVQPTPEIDSGGRDAGPRDASRDVNPPDASGRDVNQPDTNVPDTNVPDTRPPPDAETDTGSD